MKPTNFTDANVVLGAEGCGDLPAQYDGTQYLTRWSMSWRERLSALLFGRVWLCVQTQGHPPTWLRCGRNPAE